MRDEGLTVFLDPDQVSHYELGLLMAGATPEAQSAVPSTPGEIPT
jgi:hypothetical protein